MATILDCGLLIQFVQCHCIHMDILASMTMKYVNLIKHLV